MRTLTEEDVVAALGKPLDAFSHQCHGASLSLVRSGLLGDPGPSAGQARVARGTLRGIGGQHSWAVVGDPYDPEVVVDITAWSYDARWPRVLQRDGNVLHRPHGTGSIWSFGCPRAGVGPAIELSVEVSEEARNFLELVADTNGRKGLDYECWARLVTGPVQGWPAAEILKAANKTEKLSALIPMDIFGMVTDLNPQNLYW